MLVSMLGFIGNALVLSSLSVLSLVLGAIYLCLGCGVGFLGTKVLGLWFSSLGI
mgnify:CR=1 FL=1